MSITIDRGTIIHGDYEVTAPLPNDALYQWAEAERLSDRGKVLLQFLNAELAPPVIEHLFSEFTTLSSLRRDDVPNLVDRFHCLCVYRLSPAVSFSDALAESPNHAEELWRNAGDALHALHLRGLVHGHITLTSFSMVADRVHLKGFGYAAPLRAGNDVALRECAVSAAPEVMAVEHSVTPAADLYSFAKAVAQWNPAITGTPWYARSTDPEPRGRYRHMREAAAALSEALGSLELKPLPDSPGLEPCASHTIEIKVLPPGGGLVSGSGTYIAGAPATITATANDGRRFSQWTGDHTGTEATVTLKADRDYTIKAHFVAEALPIPSTPQLPSMAPPLPTPAPETLPKPGAQKIWLILVCATLIGCMWWAVAQRGHGPLPAPTPLPLPTATPVTAATTMPVATPTPHPTLTPQATPLETPPAPTRAPLPFAPVPTRRPRPTVRHPRPTVRSPKPVPTAPPVDLGSLEHAEPTPPMPPPE